MAGSRASYRSAVSFAGVSFAATALVATLGSVVVARLYGITVVGEFALASAPMGILSALSSLREQAALVRELTKLDARDPRVTGLFAAVFAFSSAFTALLALPVLGVTWLLLDGPIGEPDLFLPSLAIVAGYVLLFNPAWNLDAVFAAFRAGRELFWIRLGQQLLFLATAVALSFVLDSVWALVLATVAWYVGSLVHRLLWIGRFMRFRVSRQVVRDGMRILPEMLRFGAKAAPGAIADGLSTESQAWILGAMISVPAVGAYGRAQQLVTRLRDLSIRVDEMLFPTLMERQGVDGAEAFDRAVVDTIRYSAIALMLPAALAAGAGREVMAVFGEGFAQAGPALGILALGVVFSAVADVFVLVLWSKNRPGITSVITLGRFALTIGGSLLLTPELGLEGAAIAVLAGFLLGMLWAGATGWRYLTRPFTALWPPRQFVAWVVASLACAAAARLAIDLVPNAAGVLLACALAIPLYAAILFAGGRTERDRALIDAVRARF